MAEHIGPWIAAIWAVGSGLVVLGLCWYYSVMTSDNNRLMDSEPVSKATLKSIRKRDLAAHAADCHYRETLGAGPCSCGRE